MFAGGIILVVKQTGRIYTTITINNLMKCRGASPERAVVGRTSPLIDDLVRTTGFNSPECKQDGQKTSACIFLSLSASIVF